MHLFPFVTFFCCFLLFRCYRALISLAYANYRISLVASDGKSLVPYSPDTVVFFLVKSLICQILPAKSL